MSAITPQRCEELIRELNKTAQRAALRGDQMIYRGAHQQISELLALREERK